LQFGVQDPKGVLVSDVLDESPAKRAGLERGDVIVEFDGKPVENPTQLRNAVAQTMVGKKATVKFIRDKRLRNAEVTIAEQPKTVAQAGSERGVAIVRVRSGSVAEEAGLREGDVILEVNRKPVTTRSMYERVASKLGKDKAVLLLVKRQGRTIFVTLKP